MGADVSLKNKLGLSSLHYFAMNGNHQLASVVIPTYLIDITSTKTNLTMLHCAAQTGREEIVEYLLDHGAQV
jgi:ankyrin repeat protein